MKKINRILQTVMLVITLVMTGYNLKISTEIKEQITVEKEESIPVLEDLLYFQRHRLNIDSMGDIRNLERGEYLVFFYSNDCSHCEVTKEDIAAFIYYGFIDSVSIYFVNIDENLSVIGESEADVLEDELIDSTPTMFVINGDYYEKLEGVYDIYEKMSEYAKM